MQDAGIHMVASVQDHRLDPGVYLIRCLVNGCSYSGSSNKVRSRVLTHLKALREGKSTSPLLQCDWDRFSEEAFEVLVTRCPVGELLVWEERLTMLSDSLEDNGGYNRMLGKRTWSRSARIRNSEHKLQRQRKFTLLPVLGERLRLHPDYVRTFHQGDAPLRSRLPEIDNLSASDRQLLLHKHLRGYERFEHRQVTATT